MYKDGQIFTETRALANKVLENEKVLLNSPSKILTLEDFGAVGDGVADDTVALQNAFDSLTTNQTLYGTFGKTYRTTKLNLTNSDWTYDGRMSTIFVDTIGGVYGSSVEGSLIVQDTNIITNISIKNSYIKGKHHLDDLSYNFILTRLTGGFKNLTLENIIVEDLYCLLVGARTTLGFYAYTDVKMINCIGKTSYVTPVGTAASNKRIGYLFNINSTNNVEVIGCEAHSIFTLGLFGYSDYTSVGGGLSNNHGGKVLCYKCKAYNTGDTSIYSYAPKTIIDNCYVKDSGKDGLKINSYANTTYDCVVSNNIVEGKVAEHQADGGFHIVFAAARGRCFGNTIHGYGTLQYGKTGHCIAVGGADAEVYNNDIICDEAFSGILSYGYDTGIGNDGIKIYNNNIVCDVGDCITMNSLNKKYHIINNTLKGSNLLINASSTANVPYKSLVKGNKLTGLSITNSRGIQVYSGDRFSVIENEFHGEFEREINNAPSNTRGFVGYGNVSYAKVSSSSFAIHPRGANYDSLPTQGTFYQGEKIGSKTQGYLCLTRGTYGTPTATNATTTAGSSTITIDAVNVFEGQVITLVGESGDFLIVDDSLDGLTLTLDRNCVNSASVAVGFQAPTFSAASPFYV